MSKAIIFDMDGTIWDSAQEVADSWNEALLKLNITDAKATAEWVMSLMGQTMDAFAKGLLPNMPLEESRKILRVLEQEENEYLRVNGAMLYGAVDELFEALHADGWDVCIVSNCQAGYIEAFLDYYNLNDLVDDTLCYGDTMRGKASNLCELIKRNNYSEYWYVGDTDGDYNACKEAEVPFIFATYGFGKVEDDVPQLNELEALPELLKSL